MNNPAGRFVPFSHNRRKKNGLQRHEPAMNPLSATDTIPPQAALHSRIKERVEYAHSGQVRRGDGFHVQRSARVHVARQLRPIG